MRYNTDSVLVLVLFLCACTGSSGNTPSQPQSTPPVAALSGAETDASTQVKVLSHQRFVPVDGEQRAATDLLQKFLGARWSGDRRAAMKLVTKGDKGHVPDHVFKDRMVEYAGDGGSHAPWEWISWEIVSVDVDDSKAHGRAVVELVRPVRAPGMGALPWLVGDESKELRRLQQQGGDVDRRGLSAKLMRERRPVRVPEEQEYFLVKEEGEWRVRMGWKALAEVVKTLGYPPRAKPEQLESLDVSEKAALRRRYLGATQREVEPTLREVFMNRSSWEQRANERHYDEAAAALREQLATIKGDVPPFLARRESELREEEARWKEHMANAALELVADKPVDAGKGWFTVDVHVRNKGEHPVHTAHVELDLGPNARDSYSLHDIAPGASKSHTTRTYGAPEYQRPHPTHIILEGVTLDQGLAKSNQALLDVHVDHYLYDMPARLPALLRYSVAPLLPRLDACPSWPEDPLDVRLGFGTDGRVKSVRYSEGAPGLHHCITEVFSELQVDALWRPQVVVLPLVSATHWSRRP